MNRGGFKGAGGKGESFSRNSENNVLKGQKSGLLGAKRYFLTDLGAPNESARSYTDEPIAQPQDAEAVAVTKFSTWTTQTSTFTTAINGVAYGNGVWVAVGNRAHLRTSTDMVNWNTRTSNFGTSAINGVAYGNGVWVAAGTGALRTSTDTINWNTITGPASSFRGVFYGGGVWLAGGGSGAIYASTDAVNWNARTSGFGLSTVYAFAYDDGRGIWGAVGESVFRFSTDTITWNSRPLLGNIHFGAAYGNGVWVAVGASPFLRTSTDTVNWNTRTTFTTDALAVSYSNNTWVAVGSGGHIRSSTDTINWVTQTSTFGTSAVNSVTNNGSTWVAAGAGGALRTAESASRTQPLQFQNLTAWYEQ